MREANLSHEADRWERDNEQDSPRRLLLWAVAVPVFWIALGYGIRLWVLS